MIDGVKHCLKLKIVHRDIKVENILLDRNYNLKIADFGIISFLDEGPVNDINGSSAYFAPEVNKIYRQTVANEPPKNFDPERAMIWSLGVVLFYLLTGILPFGLNRYDVEKEIIEYKQ